MSKLATFKARLSQTKIWLTEAGFDPATHTGFDFPDVVARVREWYPKQPARATHLLTKAARQLRGQAIPNDLGGRNYSKLTLRTGDKVELVRIAGGEAAGAESYKVSVSGADGATLTANGEHDDLHLAKRSS